MAECPQCRREVGARALLFPSALAGIVCPNCQASLEPEKGRHALVALLAIAAGLALSIYLDRQGWAAWPRIVAQVAGTLAVFVLLGSRLTRLRVKRPPMPSIR